MRGRSFRRQIVQRQLGDILKLDVGVAVVSDIGRNLHRVEVIGEQATPGFAKASSGHASASKKFQEGQLAFTHRRQAEAER